MTDISRVRVDVCPKCNRQLNKQFDTVGCVGGACPDCKTWWTVDHFAQREVQVIEINLPDVTTKPKAQL